MKIHPREILSSLAAEAGKRIIDVLGAEAVRAIFVTGSLPRGEIAWFDRGDKIEIYSDVDISVVVSDDAGWEESRNLARRAVSGIAREGDHFEWMRSADVGVYVLNDLLAQPARPGTVDASRCHQLLYGDADIPKMMEHISASDIDRKEALYLLENRLIEKADLFERIRMGARESIKRYALYAAHKTCSDAGAAALIVAKRFSEDAGARQQALWEIAGDTVGESMLSKQDLAQVERSVHSLMDLRHAINNEKKSYDEVWRDVESLVLALWRRFCSITMAVGANPGWASLVAKRCRRGDIPGNMRTFSSLARRRDFGIVRSLLMGVLNVRFSPVDALRVSGLVQSVMRNSQAGDEARSLAETFVPFLDRLTRTFGHGEGEVFARARKLYREIN